MRWAGLVARLVVGGLWIWAGTIKLPDPEASVMAVRAYLLLSLEIAVGACLVLGPITRVSAAVSALLQIAFIIGVASVWSRGIAISCGCFGDGVGRSPGGGHPPSRP